MEQNDWSERNVNGKQTFPKSRKRKRKQEEKKQKKFKSEKDKKDCGNNNCNVVPSSSDKSGHSKNIDSLTASKRYVEEESRYTKKTDIKKLYHDSNRRETKKSQEGKTNITKSKEANVSISNKYKKGNSSSKNVSDDEHCKLSFKNVSKSSDSKQSSSVTKYRDIKEMSEVHDQRQNYSGQSRQNQKQFKRWNNPQGKKQRNIKEKRHNIFHQNSSKSLSCRSENYKSKPGGSLINTGADRTDHKVENHDADECLVIPGFYYDKEKKKYFKILPNHSNISSTVTREVIQKKEKEEKRLNDLALLARKFHTVSVIPRKKFVNLPCLLLSQAQGNITHRKLDNLFLKGRISNLKPPDPVNVVNISPEFTSYERLDHMLHIDVNSNHDQILGLWSVKDSLLQRIQLLKMWEKTRFSESNPLSVNIGTTGRTVIQSLNKITNVCWANIPGESFDSNILYTLMCPTGDYCSMVRIRSLTSGSDSRLNTRNNFDFMLGPRAVWTCAWNGYTKQFSVGSEKQSLLIDVRTRKLWELKTGDSDALSQVFSGQGKPCLYSGTRKGQILTHDLRSNSVRPVDCLRMTSSISCLRLLQDDVRLLASDVKGKINLWDIRMKKELVEYKGCKNEYSRIPVHIDEMERLVYGVGQDGYVNFWCLNSGKLLRSLPPPVTTDIDTIPAVKYSERWGNKQGNSGLVMGLGDKLFLYSSFTSESQTV